MIVSRFWCFARQIAVLLVTLQVSPACRQHTAADIKSGGVVDPDSVSPVCDKVLSSKAPYTPKEFADKIREAINQGVKSGVLKEENLRDFLFAEQVAAAMRGGLTGDILSFNDCSITQAINESLTKPNYFYRLTGNGRTTDGGMTMYKGDVFAEGFYRSRASDVEGSIFHRERYTLTQIMNEQPWFEWNQDSRSFTAKVGSPAVRLAQHIQGDQGSEFLTLHRGTNVAYSVKRQALAAVNTFSFGKFGGVFTTPSFEAAKGWASPVVLSAKLDPKEFIKQATVANVDREGVPVIYVGVEYGYPGIAFLYSPGDTKNLFFDSITAKCVTDRAEGSDVNFAPQCK